MKFIWFLYLFTIVVFLASFQLSDADVPAPASIGTPPAQRGWNWNDLVGKDFIILYKLKTEDDESRNYNLLRLQHGNTPLDLRYESNATSDPGLLYDKFCGKTISLTNVLSDGPDLPGTACIFACGSLDVNIYAEGLLSGGIEQCVQDIAPADEIISAQALIGKTVYLRCRQLYTYDSASNTESQVDWTFGTQAKIVSVDWGFHSYAPIRVVLQRTDNQRAYYNIAFNAINKDADWYSRDTWQNFFFETDPRQLCPCDDATWQEIVDQKVSINMTE